MDELVAWLRQQLEDDEAVAKAADGTTWMYYERDQDIHIEAEEGPHIGLLGEASWDGVEQNAVHIARHDPAAVLADIMAKRAVLDAYEADKAHNEALGLNFGAFHNNEPEPHPEVQGSDRKTVPGLEKAVRTLASAYRHRPGWKSIWE